MNRIVLGLLFIMICVDAFAQVEMRVEDGAGNVDDVVSVTLFATRARDVTSFSFPISFNTDKLVYEGFENLFDQALVLDTTDLSNGQIGVTWSDATLMGLNDFRVEFVDLRFRIKDGCRSNDPIEFEGTIEDKETFMVDDDGNVVPATTNYFDGEVRTECIRGVIEVEQVDIGEVASVSVPVYVEDLEGLIAIFFRVSYDQTKLTYTGFDNPHFDRGLNVNENDGLITVLWEESDLIPTDVLDRVTFLELNFDNLMTCGNSADLVLEEGDFNAIIDLTVYTEYGILTNGAVNVECRPVADFDVTNVNCFGESTGSITLDVSSGVPPYFYEWEDGIITKDRSDIPAGLYTVTITDSNMEELILEDIEVTQNDEILASIDQQGDCETGNITVSLTPMGGDAPYDIDWSNGEEGSPIVIDNAPITLSVTVTDDLSCTKEFTNILIEEVASFTLDFNESDVVCKGDSDGAIDLIVTGGQEPFTYNWIGPNNYMADTEDIDGLEAGMYSISVEDGNNCSGFLSIEIMEPAVALNADVSATGDDGTGNGRATVIAEGGNQPYTYAWSCSNETDAIVENLMNGDCCVSITDVGGCEIVECFNIPLVQNNNEIQGVTQFLTYPNPIQDRLGLVLEFSELQDIRIELFNNMGQLLYSKEVSAQSEIIEEIPMELNSSGSYFVKITNDKNEQLARRVIKL